MSGICEERLRIGSDEVNMHRVLRTSTMFELMQRISIRQMEEFGIGREKTLDKGLLWVILRQWAVAERLPEYDEQVILRSWPGEMMHVIFPRHYEMVSERGETLVRAQALWMLIDQNTRHHVFPDEHGIEVQGFKTGRELPPMPSIAVPENSSETGTHRRPEAGASDPPEDGRNRDQSAGKVSALYESKDSLKEFDLAVPYSMVDINGHMNNTRYFDLAEDYSPRAQSGVPLREAQIEYFSEAKFGSTLHMKLETEGETDFFTANIGEKNCFRMKLKYMERKKQLWQN